MEELTIILSIILFFSLLISYINLAIKKTAVDIVNDMGIGYNLGNSFDSFNISQDVKNPDEQITLYGNPLPTKNMIKNIKKNGFKTIRFPVTWIYFIDNLGNIDPIWMSRVKEVVNWTIEYNMYCILNVHHDGLKGNWLSKGIESLDKYINLWKQIANEFKGYDEHLIFEAMDEVEFTYLVYNNYEDEYYPEYNYTTLFNFAQAFVDTIRNSGGINKERLLIITGHNADFYATCSSNFQVPNDPANKLAISIHYFFPYIFTIEPINNLFRDNDYYMSLIKNWGSNIDYNEIFENFNKMRTTFVEKGIPVILGKVGVLTEENKDINSIREYLYLLFSLSTEYEGMMSCLWDTSNKITGDMNYYNREINKWYDEILLNNFINISKGKYVKSSDYYVISNKTTLYDLNNRIYPDITFLIGDRKPIRIIMNVKFTGTLHKDYEFDILCYDKNMKYFKISYTKENFKKQYDGTNICTFDVSNEDCKEYIEVVIDWGRENVVINNFTVEFNQTFKTFDYYSYKGNISKNIN